MRPRIFRLRSTLWLRLAHVVSGAATLSSEAGDVMLVVEVMETSASYDRDVKVPLYARFGIRETWLVDLDARLIEVYRNPTPQGSQSVQRFQPGRQVSPQAFPDLPLAVDEILG